MVMKKLFAKPKNKTSILGESAAKQKKLFEKAAEKSTKLQLEVLKEYEQTFGERIEDRR